MNLLLWIGFQKNIEQYFKFVEGKLDLTRTQDDDGNVYFEVKNGSTADEKTKATIVKLNGALRNCSTNPMDASKEIYNIVKNFLKYEYHQAGLIGILPNGEAITTEAFAAESTQSIASPLTMGGAVGIYRGGMSGFKNYYSEDDPFPANDEAELFSQIKELVYG